MDKWIKIEEKLNQLIKMIFAWLNQLSSKLTPDRFKVGYQKRRTKAVNRKKQMLEFFKRTGQKVIGVALKLKELASKWQMFVRKLIATTSTFAKNFKLKDVQLKKYFFVLTSFIAPVFLKAKKWVMALKPETVVLTTSGVTMATLAFIGALQSTQDIAEKTDPEKREPASIDKAADLITRPNYYKAERKHLKVYGIQMPVFVSSEAKHYSLRLDLTFESSNRYIREYFFKDTHLLKDVLNTKIEPIVPSFPLEKEGKDIIKAKMKEELNKLLQEKNIKGEIKEVRIDSIISA